MTNSDLEDGLEEPKQAKDGIVMVERIEVRERAGSVKGGTIGLRPVSRSSSLRWSTKILFVLLACSFLVNGCATLDKGMIEALAKDESSFCARVIGYGGAISIMPGAAVPVIPGGGGYGSLEFCRSNREGAKVSIEGGKISIEN